MLLRADRLEGVLPELQQNVDALFDEAFTRHYIVARVKEDGGLRTKARTEQLIAWRDEAVATARARAIARKLPAADVERAAAAAYYRVAPFEAGYHPVGGAIDFEIVAAPPGMQLGSAYSAVGVLAPTHGLRWGGTFSTPKDIYHLELALARDVVAAMYDKFVAQRQVDPTHG